VNDLQPPDDQVPRNALVLAASVLYGIFVCIAVLWFWLRERQHRLSEIAVGDDAMWSLLLGAAVGLGVSGVIWLGVRYLKQFSKLEGRLQEFIGELNETEIIAIAMTSAIGEEMLFRGALQDHLGGYWYLSALVFGLLHTGPGLLLWAGVATVLGLLFSVMVHFGFGLLSVTVAHALINFISLRRMSL
jgi:membrane protease YdiL (CAAX protease family)